MDLILGVVIVVIDFGRVVPSLLINSCKSGRESSPRGGIDYDLTCFFPGRLPASIPVKKHINHLHGILFICFVLYLSRLYWSSIRVSKQRGRIYFNDDHITETTPSFKMVNHLLKVVRVENSWSGYKDLNYVSLYICQVTLHSISLWAGYLKFLWIHALFFLCISLIIIRTKIKKNSYFNALTRNEENEKV